MTTDEIYSGIVNWRVLAEELYTQNSEVNCIACVLADIYCFLKETLLLLSFNTVLTHVPSFILVS